ncbi:MAG: hypothetical protein ACI8RP_001132 [Urechidicola sp.]|jgi:hypothetical protein
MNLELWNTFGNRIRAGISSQVADTDNKRYFIRFTKKWDTEKIYINPRATNRKFSLR